MSGWRFWVLLGVACAVCCLPLLSNNNYLLQVLFRIALFGGLGLAWNLVGGYAGQVPGEPQPGKQRNAEEHLE